MKEQQEQHISQFIGSICKDKTPEEQREAEANFMKYLQLAEKISNRLANEKESNLD